MRPGARAVYMGRERRLYIENIWGVKSAVMAKLWGIKEKPQ